MKHYKAVEFFFEIFRCQAPSPIKDFLATVLSTSPEWTWQTHTHWLLQLHNTFLLSYNHKTAHHVLQGRIQPVRLGGAISVIVGNQVSQRLRYCKRDEACYTTLVWQNNGRQNGFSSRMLFSEMYKIMVNKVTFAGFTGPGSPPASLQTRYKNNGR